MKNMSHTIGNFYLLTKSETKKCKENTFTLSNISLKHSFIHPYIDNKFMMIMNTKLNQFIIQSSSDFLSICNSSTSKTKVAPPEGNNHIQMLVKYCLKSIQKIGYLIYMRRDLSLFQKSTLTFTTMIETSIDRQS